LIFAIAISLFRPDITAAIFDIISMPVFDIIITSAPLAFFASAYFRILIAITLSRHTLLFSYH